MHAHRAIFSAFLLFVLASPAPAAEPLVLQRPTFIVTQFGASGNGIDDDWPAIQRAINEAGKHPEGGTVVIPRPSAGGTWRLSRALHMRSQVTLKVTEPETKIQCLGRPPSVWPETGCVMFGNYTAGTLAKTPSTLLTRVMEGDRTVRLREPLAGSTLVVGDLVVVSSSSTFRIGRDKDAYSVPTSLEVNRVESVSPDGLTLGLRYPLRQTVDAAVVRKLGQRAPGQTELADKEVAWATFGARLIGGTWEASSGMPIPFAAAGGALDCTIKPHSVAAYTGVGYGNLYARCTISAHVQRITGVAMELAFGSHDNTISADQLYMGTQPNVAKPVPWFIGVNEGAKRNSIWIRYMEIGDAGFDVVRLDSASDNHIRLANLSGARIGGFVVRILSSGFAGAPPDAVRNVISVDESAVDSQRGYFVNAAGPTNSVTGRFSGMVVPR